MNVFICFLNIISIFEDKSRNEIISQKEWSDEDFSDEDYTRFITNKKFISRYYMFLSENLIT